MTTLPGSQEDISNSKTMSTSGNDSSQVWLSTNQKISQPIFEPSQFSINSPFSSLKTD